MRRQIIFGTLSLAILVGWAPSLQANSDSSREDGNGVSSTLPQDLAAQSMEELARKVIARFESEHVYRISPFQGPRDGGSELRIRLIEAMESQGARISDSQYKYDVQGRYAAIHNEHGIAGLRVSIEVVDEFGRPVDAFDASTSWEDINSVPRLLSINAVIPPDVHPVVRAEMLEQQWNASPVHVVNDRVRTDPRGGFGVEMLVREKERLVRRSLATDGPSGASTVRLHDREVYAIRLWNYTSQEVAAEVTIDGVNVFHHDDRKPRPKHFLVPAAQPGRPNSTTITGYSFGPTEVQWFRIGGLGESVAAEAEVEDLSQVGQIVVQFSPTSLGNLDPGDVDRHGNPLPLPIGEEDSEIAPATGSPPVYEHRTGGSQSSGTRGQRPGSISMGQGRSGQAMSSGGRGLSHGDGVPTYATGRGPSREQRTQVQFRRIDAAVATVVVRYVVE